MQSTSGFDLATNLMEDYQLFTSASTSSLDKESSQVFYFHSDNENGAGAEAGTQQLDDNNKSQPSGISSSGEIKVKPGKTDGVNKDTRRHRYAFQTRSQVDILDDGYRWRKYGQKAVKNNKFPRSYYKCTHKGCNVKKQVQRNSKDEETVVTTYEGIHIHPTDRSFQNFEDILRQMQTYTPF